MFLSQRLVAFRDGGCDMIKKVISGGQTGADMGGLFAASTHPGIETGGYAPKGFLTENGPKKILGKKFKLKETKSPKYPPRTKQNVLDSDGTLIFGDTISSGSRLTMRLCHQHDRPIKRIRYSEKFHRPSRREIPGLVKWVKTHNIETLNIAGNRESTNPGITMYVEAVVSRLLRELSKIE